MPDSDGDGWADFTDCAPNNARINPGVDDKPDAPSFRDTNCDGIDGNTRRAVFVSPLGDDDAPGTRAQPKQTLAAAVAAARSQKKDVYATRGIYHELLFVANAVGVYGGYDTSWRRSTSNVTRITGGATSDYTTGAIATNVTARTSVQLLTLTPAAPTSSGASSYGLRGINSGGLVLDHVTARAAVARDGGTGSTGSDGRPATNGKNGADGGAGGTSAAGRTGGNGGGGGAYPGGNSDGEDGKHGELTTQDAWGRLGGPGGEGRPEDDTTEAEDGYDADFGVFRGDGLGGGSGNAVPGAGYWLTRSGQSAPSGTNGHGGGGGGGGGGEGCIFCGVGSTDFGGTGGGGGGGGEGGAGGRGGQGGGGSFGLFLENSAGALVRNRPSRPRTAETAEGVVAVVSEASAALAALLRRPPEATPVPEGPVAMAATGQRR